MLRSQIFQITLYSEGAYQMKDLWMMTSDQLNEIKEEMFKKADTLKKASQSGKTTTY